MAHTRCFTTQAISRTKIIERDTVENCQGYKNDIFGDCHKQFITNLSAIGYLFTMKNETKKPVATISELLSAKPTFSKFQIII